MDGSASSKQPQLTTKPDNESDVVEVPSNEIRTMPPGFDISKIEGLTEEQIWNRRYGSIIGASVCFNPMEYTTHGALPAESNKHVYQLSGQQQLDIANAYNSLLSNENRWPCKITKEHVPTLQKYASLTSLEDLLSEESAQAATASR